MSFSTFHSDAWARMDDHDKAFSSDEDSDYDGYHTAAEDLPLFDSNAPEFIPSNPIDSDDDDDAPIPGLADYIAARARKEARKARKAARKARKEARKKARIKLATYLRRCVQKDQLIGRIITHFRRKDTMTEAEYYALRGDDFRTNFKGGMMGAVYHLQNTPNAWLRAHQSIRGSIVHVISPTEVRVQDTWKRLIQNALSTLEMSAAE
jgi:hypothetical protein